MRIKGSATPMADNVNLVAESPQFVEYEEGYFINVDTIASFSLSQKSFITTSETQPGPYNIDPEYIDNFKRLVGKTDED